MTTAKNASDFAEPIDYVGALKLAVEAGASTDSSYRLMCRILEYAPDPDGTATMPTRILIDAIRDLGATVNVP
jgi:hypothetical protein